MFPTVGGENVFVEIVVWKFIKSIHLGHIVFILGILCVRKWNAGGRAIAIIYFVGKVQGRRKFVPVY